MARDPDDEDDALRWEGDDDSTLAPGWRRVGTPVPLTRAGETAGEGKGTDGAPPAVEPEPDSRTRTQTGSVELVLIGVLGGAYLLYTIGWLLTAVRTTQPGMGVLGDVMYGIGLWLAVLAPGLWFALVYALARRPQVRLVWLAIGAVVLVPLPFVLGVTV